MSILHYVFEAGDAPRLGCAEMGCSPPAQLPAASLCRQRNGGAHRAHGCVCSLTAGV